MKGRKTYALSAVSIATVTLAASASSQIYPLRQGPFIPGRLVVVQAGEGLNTNLNDAVSGFIEFDKNSPFPLGPLAPNSRRAVSMLSGFLTGTLYTGMQSTKGQLTRSPDGRYLSSFGYTYATELDTYWNFFWGDMRPPHLDFKADYCVYSFDANGLPGVLATSPDLGSPGDKYCGIADPAANPMVANIAGDTGLLSYKFTPPEGFFIAFDNHNGHVFGRSTPMTGMVWMDTKITTSSATWGAVAGGRTTFAISNGEMWNPAMRLPPGLYATHGLLTYGSNNYFSPVITKDQYPSLTGKVSTALVVNDTLVYIAESEPGANTIHMFRRPSSGFPIWSETTFNLGTDEAGRGLKDNAVHSMCYDAETNQVFATTKAPFDDFSSKGAGFNGSKLVPNRVVTFPAGVNPNPDGSLQQCRIRTVARAGSFSEFHGIAFSPSMVSESDIRSESTARSDGGWRTIDSCADASSKNSSFVLFEDAASTKSDGTYGSRIRIARADPLSIGNAKSGNTFQLPQGVQPLRVFPSSGGSARILAVDANSHRALIYSVDQWLNINGQWSSCGTSDGMHPVSLANDLSTGGAALLWSGIMGTEDGAQHKFFVQELNSSGTLIKPYVGTGSGYYIADFDARDIQQHPLSKKWVIMLGSTDGVGKAIFASLSPDLKASQALVSSLNPMNIPPVPDEATGTPVVSPVRFGFGSYNARTGRQDGSAFVLNTGPGTLFRIDQVALSGNDVISTMQGTAFRWDNANQQGGGVMPLGPVGLQGGRLHYARSLNIFGSNPTVGVISLEKFPTFGSEPAQGAPLSLRLLSLNSSMSMTNIQSPPISLRLLPGLAPLP